MNHISTLPTMKPRARAKAPPKTLKKPVAKGSTKKAEATKAKNISQTI